MEEPILTLTQSEEAEQKRLASLINLSSPQRRGMILEMLVLENMKILKENNQLRERLGLEPRPGYVYMVN